MCKAKSFLCFVSFLAKVLIATGDPYESGHNTEVIDLQNPGLNCDALPNTHDRSNAVGGLLEDQALICGGVFNKQALQDCFVIGQSEKKIEMLEKRAYAASVVIDTNILWIIGGSDDQKRLSTSEFLTLGEAPKKVIIKCFDSGYIKLFILLCLGA